MFRPDVTLGKGAIESRINTRLQNGRWATHGQCELNHGQIDDKRSGANLEQSKSRAPCAGYGE